MLKKKRTSINLSPTKKMRFWGHYDLQTALEVRSYLIDLFIPNGGRKKEERTHLALVELSASPQLKILIDNIHSSRVSGIYQQVFFTTLTPWNGSNCQTCLRQDLPLCAAWSVTLPASKKSLLPEGVIPGNRPPRRWKFLICWVENGGLVSKLYFTRIQGVGVTRS